MSILNNTDLTSSHAKHSMPDQMQAVTNASKFFPVNPKNSRSLKMNQLCFNFPSPSAETTQTGQFKCI